MERPSAAPAISVGRSCLGAIGLKLRLPVSVWHGVGHLFAEHVVVAFPDGVAERHLVALCQRNRKPDWYPDPQRYRVAICHCQRHCEFDGYS